jgi:hypothetical protein
MLLTLTKLAASKCNFAVIIGFQGQGVSSLNSEKICWTMHGFWFPGIDILWEIEVASQVVDMRSQLRQKQT